MSALSSILEMVEAGNYKIEDYIEHQEDNDQDSEEEKDKKIPQNISESPKQTVDVEQNKQK